MKTGIRYTIHSQPMRSTIWHVVGFMFFANAFWGLLPILSRQQLGGDAAFFGILMGLIGLGAVGGAFLLPWLKQKLTATQVVVLGSLGTSLVTGYFAFAKTPVLALIVSLLFGISWTFVLATINISAQQALPDWVRGRGLATFMVAFFGSMSLGATFWGLIADMFSLNSALLAAAIGGILFCALSYGKPLNQGALIDHTPSYHWSEPSTYHHVDHGAGPVVIQIFYDIDDQDRSQFIEYVHDLKDIRMRNGAFYWGVYEDTETKGTFIEQFCENSWADHLRHHNRISQAEKSVQKRVATLHKGQADPEVKHFIAVHKS